MKKTSNKQLKFVVIAMTLALPIPNVNAFGPPDSIPGIGNVNALGLPDNIPGIANEGSKSANINWSDLASMGDSAEKKLYQGTYLLVLSTITMAESLGYKEEAAALKSQINKISEEGSVSGDFDLKVTTQQAGSVMEKISGDKEQLLSLSEEQKSKLTESMSQYVVGTLKYVDGVKTIKEVAINAKDAPMTQITTFFGIIKLAPVATEGAKNLFRKVPDAIKMMTTADITMPDNIEEMPGISNF